MSRNDIQDLHHQARALLDEQNMTAALIAGALAGVIAAVCYGLIVRYWPFAAGFSLAGIGVFVGFWMGFLGRGIEARFTVASVALTLLACGLAYVAPEFLKAVTTPGPIDLQPGLLRGLEDIALGDAIYWFISVFAAGFLAKRPLSRTQRHAVRAFELHEPPGEG